MANRQAGNDRAWLDPPGGDAYGPVPHAADPTAARALIPLTTAPGGEDSREPAPPFVGILPEPPFGPGGLADRIAAEIKTGFGYNFEDVADAHVEIRDSRKEGGTDSHLGYRPLDAEAALGLVLRGGPIGLTFDSVNAPRRRYPMR